MARKVQVVLEDDIDGGPADETVSFSLDGVAYEIDLSADNAGRLREAFAPFVGAARKASGPARRAARPKVSRTSAAVSDPVATPGAIRAWAREEGIAVNERGRIPADLLARYEAAHA